MRIRPLARRTRAAVLLALPTFALAQATPPLPPPAARAILLPDTLGANFSIADSARAAGTPGDFDFLVGSWTFRFQSRRPDGAFLPAFTGQWTVERKRVANAFVQDHWRADDVAARSADEGTWTYRVFNPRRKIWEMQGVDSDAGAWAPGVCWPSGADRLLVQHYGRVIMRIRYLAITDTSFLWRADRSVDGGATWSLDAWTMEAHRAGAK